jgi:hypothetical protein
MNRSDPKLVRAAKSSPWILIAVGLHVILATVLSVVVIRHERQKSRASASSIAVVPARRAPEVAALPDPVPVRARIPEHERVELVRPDEAEAFVPTDVLPPETDFYADLGDPTGSEGDDGTSTAATSIGVGRGGHRGAGVSAGLVTGRPGTGSGKGPPGRTTASRPLGTEEAVLEGLRWLMRHQEDDGSWSAARLHAHCSTRTPCIAPDPSLDSTFDVGMTALALLAFLGHGISVGSRVELADPAMGRPPQPAGEIVKRGVRWLLERQESDGSFSQQAPFALPENDTLPTMALCEAYAL